MSENAVLLPDCKHIRIRDHNDYSLSAENFIKSVESQYRIDFRSLPNWQALVQRLHVSTTDCKRKLQDANQRKKHIIDKIYLQGTRASPFDLTDNLMRTAKKWNRLRFERKTRLISIQPLSYTIPSNEDVEAEEISGDASEIIFTAHPNTEIIPSVDIPQPQLKADLEIESFPNAIIPHLPANISLNQHKLISPPRSRDSAVSCIAFPSAKLEDVFETKENEWELLRQTTFVKSAPELIRIDKYSLKVQNVKFSVTNCTNQYVHIRFKCITDRTAFKKAILLPVTPLKLYPGIAVTFKFIFRLSRREEFTSNLYFRVGTNALEKSPAEAFCIPIESKFKKSRRLLVSDTVFIQPVYPWQVYNSLEYKTGYVNIAVEDDYYYHLHISKRIVDLVNEPSDSLVSLDVVGPNTESMIQRTEDHEVQFQSKSLCTSMDAHQTNDIQSLQTIDVIALIIDELVELALEVFVFKNTYVYLHPRSKRKISIYFTKAEYIGHHQSYYDFYFCDPETEEVMVTKTVKVFAEVLPHPIQINPLLLDMSHSQITHGFCQEHFTVSNTHKVYPVTVKIKLTSKMKKILLVHPLEVLISPKMSMNFEVKVCSKEFLSAEEFNDLVHFTIKIIISGHRDVYNNVPPFFYEIIAPCALEFKKIYNEKYYKEVLIESQM